MARRTGFHAVLDLPPTLSRGELLNVAFRVGAAHRGRAGAAAADDGAHAAGAPRPLAKWGEALAPFVAEAKQQGFRGDGSPVAQGLYVLFALPKDGFTKTRDPRLDPPVRVTGIFKTHLRGARPRAQH